MALWKMNTNSVLNAVIVTVIVFTVIGSTLGLIFTSFTNISNVLTANGVPLANLFSASGILGMIVVAGLITFAISVFLSKGKR